MVKVLDYLSIMSALARQAGAAILDIYQHEDVGVTTKADQSPLTRADLAAHRIIVNGLTSAVPGIPVLSEESDAVPYGVRRHWQQYFLVDPLDGTKEFISRNGEFTVNIALVSQGVPVQGVVYVPVRGELYAGDLATASATVESGGRRSEIFTRVGIDPALHPDEPLTVVASRRHGGAALEACLAALGRRFRHIETTTMGSSLKLCLVAAGQADVYPRLAPTSEWDTAAAQVIVEAAGGLVVDTQFKPLRCNTGESMLNPHFYVFGDAEFDWQATLGTIPGAMPGATTGD